MGNEADTPAVTRRPISEPGKESLSFKIGQVRSFTVRSLKEMFRNKAVLFWAIAWPVGWYFLTVLFFIEMPANVPPGEEEMVRRSIRASNAISFGVFGAFTVALVMFANMFADDLTEKRYRKFRSLPISPFVDLAGRFLAGIAVAIVSFVVVMVVGSLHGASFTLLNPISVLIVLLGLVMFCIIVMSFAVVLSVLVTSGEFLTIITTSLLLMLYFLTGYNGVQPTILPEANQWIVNVAPNSLVTRIQLHYLTDFPIEEAGLSPPSMPAGPEYLLLLAGFAVGGWLLALLVMRRHIYRGEGGE